MSQTGRGRILVLVGEAGKRSAIVRSLEGAELEVRYYDEPHPLDELRDEHVVPDLVVLDWNLDGRKAPETLRFIASTPKFVRTRVVVLTDTPAEVPMLCVAATLPTTSTPSDLLATITRVRHDN